VHELWHDDGLRGAAVTLDETRRLAAMVQALWPHSAMLPSTPDVWHHFTGSFGFDEAEGALRDLLAEGREHAPPVGAIVRRCAEREVCAPDWDEAWREALRLMPRVPTTAVPTERDFSHPAVAAWAVPAWAELRFGPAEGTGGFGTHYAQQREAYRAVAAREQRSRALGMVGAPRRRGQLRPAAAALALVEGGAGAA
jgi:hypothetical protein